MKTLLSLCAAYALAGLTPALDVPSVQTTLETALELGESGLGALQAAVHRLATPEFWMGIVGAPALADMTVW